MPTPLDALKTEIKKLEQERSNLQGKIAGLTKDNGQLRMEVVNLQAELDIVNKKLDIIRDLVNRPPLPPPEDTGRFRIDFDPNGSHARISFKDYDPITISQPQQYKLLRHIVLCAFGHIDCESVQGGVKFHTAWLEYLDPDNAIHNFAPTVTKLNEIVARFLSGQPSPEGGIAKSWIYSKLFPERKNAYLLRPERHGPAGTGCYVVRINGELGLACETNIDQVDLYLKPPHLRNPREIAAELGRCNRAIHRIANSAPNGEALKASDQITAMRDRLDPPAIAPWVLLVKQKIEDVQTLKSPRYIDPSTLEEEVHMEIVELTTLIQDIIQPIAVKLGLTSKQGHWNVVIEALFQTAQNSCPDYWITREQVTNHFKVALLIELLFADRSDEQFKQRVIHVFGTDILDIPSTEIDTPTKQRIGQFMLHLKSRGNWISHANVLHYVQTSWVGFYPI